MTFRNKYSTFWHQSPTSVYAIDWACCIACFAYLCLRDLSQSGPFAERGGDQEGHQALGRSRSKLTLRGHVVVKKIQLPTWVKGILRRHAKSIYTIYDITWHNCESSSWFFWTPFLPCTMEATLMWHEFYGGARRGWYRSVRVTWRKTTHFVSFCHLHFFGVTETAWLQVQTAGCVFADALGQPKFGIRQVFGCLPSSIRQWGRTAVISPCQVACTEACTEISETCRNWRLFEFWTCLRGGDYRLTRSTLAVSAREATWPCRRAKIALKCMLKGDVLAKWCRSF